MEFLVNLLFDILTAILSLLPASPFLLMLDKVEDIPVLGIVNWFIPFDNCFLCLEIWCGAMAVYYVVKNIDKVLDTWSRIKSIF